MKCKDCKDNGKCETQKHYAKLEEEGRGAVFIGDKLVGCDKYDKKPRGVLTLRTSD